MVTVTAIIGHCTSQAKVSAISLDLMNTSVLRGFYSEL